MELRKDWHTFRVFYRLSLGVNFFASALYEGHPEIIDTQLVFWTLDEIKKSAHSKVKREDWFGKKREKVGQLCPSMETGTVQGKAGVSCTHLINQSMTASSHKAIVLPKTFPNLILPIADILHWITQDRGLN